MSTNRLSLLGVPQEIFEQIARAADPSDLLNLRLASSETERKLDKVYTEVHFTERAFYVSLECSLTALLTIVQNEKYGRAMRKIVFYEDIIERPQQSRTVLATNPMTEREKDGHQQLWVDVWAQQVYYHFFGEDYKLLMRIFARLKHYNNPIEIEIAGTWYACSKRKAVGYDRIPYLSFIDMEPNATRSLDTVLTALNHSCLGIHDLNLHGSGTQYLDIITARSLNKSKSLFSDGKEVIQGLRSLTLSLNESATNPLERRPPEDLAQVIEVFSGSHRLKSLKFNGLGCLEGPTLFKPDWGNLDLGKAFLKAHLPAIKHLTLIGMTFDCTNFVAFLRNLPTLQYLELHRVWLVDARRWPEGLFPKQSRLISDPQWPGSVLVDAAWDLDKTLRSLTTIENIAVFNCTVTSQGVDRIEEL